jgi:hypothetical protein
MINRLRQWLLQRRKSVPVEPIAPSLMWRERRIHEMIADDLATDPTICSPILGLPTAHITRIIDQGETVAVPCRWWQYEDTIEDRARTSLIETALMPSV